MFLRESHQRGTLAERLQPLTRGGSAGNGVPASRARAMPADHQDCHRTGRHDEACEREAVPRLQHQVPPHPPHGKVIPPFTIFTPLNREQEVDCTTGHSVKKQCLELARSAHFQGKVQLPQRGVAAQFTESGTARLLRGRAGTAGPLHGHSRPCSRQCGQPLPCSERKQSVWAPVTV